jgi:TonB family protein
MVVQKVPPTYPDAARSAGVEGTVVLSLLVGTTGEVEKVSTVSGDTVLADAAMQAVKQWKYKPYTLDGTAVRMETQISIAFHLKVKPHAPPPPGKFTKETYENEYFGIRYPLSRDWVRETELMRKRLAPEGSQPTSYVLLAAVHVPLDRSVADADSSFVFLALDRSAVTGGSCRPHLEAFAASLHASKQADLRGDIAQFTAGGLTFDRADMEFRGNVSLAHQTFVCTVVKDFLLQWNILGTSKSAVETVLATLQGINGTPPAEPAASPSSLPSMVRVSAGVSAGLIVKKVQPHYPDAARQAHIQGSVVMRAVINEAGDIADIEVIEGPMDFVPATVSAVRQWKYKPYLLMGKPMKVETQITVIYTLSPG